MILVIVKYEKKKSKYYSIIQIQFKVLPCAEIYNEEFEPSYKYTVYKSLWMEN